MVIVKIWDRTASRFSDPLVAFDAMVVAELHRQDDETATEMQRDIGI